MDMLISTDPWQSTRGHRLMSIGRGRVHSSSVIMATSGLFLCYEAKEGGLLLQ